MEWIKCSDELPLANKRVLITTIYGDVVEACRNKGCEFNRFGQKCTATHWMPLPQPPEQEVKSALEIGMSRYEGAMQKLAEGGD